MRVQEVMKSMPSVCHPQDRLTTAGRTMSQVGCGVLPVVDRNGALVGVLTDRDICEVLTSLDETPGEITVSKAMTSQVHTCAARDQVADALETMKRHQVRRLPVVDDDGKAEAILSLDDIAAAAHGSAKDVSDVTWAEVGAALQAISRHRTPARLALG